jgi:hypothetical protein
MVEAQRGAEAGKLTFATAATMAAPPQPRATPSRPLRVMAPVRNRFYPIEKGVYTELTGLWQSLT